MCEVGVAGVVVAYRYLGKLSIIQDDRYVFTLAQLSLRRF